MVCCLACFVQAQESGAAKGPAASAAGDGRADLHCGAQSDEFDGRLIKGERAAGAVYLLNRA